MCAGFSIVYRLLQEPSCYPTYRNCLLSRTGKVVTAIDGCSTICRPPQNVNDVCSCPPASHCISLFSASRRNLRFLARPPGLVWCSARAARATWGQARVCIFWHSSAGCCRVLGMGTSQRTMHGQFSIMVMHGHRRRPTGRLGQVEERRPERAVTGWTTRSGLAWQDTAARAVHTCARTHDQPRTQGGWGSHT